MKSLPLLIGLIATTLCACSQPHSDKALGTLEYDRLELSAPRSEPIIEVAVEEGQRVAAGTLLVALDPKPTQARLRQLKAEQARARARLDEVIRGPRTEQVAAERARLRHAAAELEDAEADLNRVRALRQQGLVPQADLDRAQARHGQAMASRDEAANLLQASVEGSTAEEVEQVRQQLAAAEAAVQNAAIDLDRLLLRAPRPGLIEALPYHAGEQPPAGIPLAVLLDTARPYARVFIPETARAALRPGQRLSVRLAGQTVEGTVRRIGADALFTPYYALTEADRSRLAYLAEIDLPAQFDSHAGMPLEVVLP